MLNSEESKRLRSDLYCLLGLSETAAKMQMGAATQVLIDGKRHVIDLPSSRSVIRFHRGQEMILDTRSPDPLFALGHA